ncbi:MAG: heparinase II/III-family protein [Lachnospiraceae bacterium]|jgi:hypothetical protein|nr:heparinase II/III-family protein [Lachnospiraceae bacterium]
MHEGTARSPFHFPFPDIDDRPAWDGLPTDVKDALVADAARTPYPTLLATDYLEFSRTGDRGHFEEKYFRRRTMLDAFVLAECICDDGRFLDDIVNGLALICEEPAWQLPAHNSYIRDTPQLPLPDVTRPVIDLFAAETGAILGVACRLLKPRLDAVSPIILDNVGHTLRNRLVGPYLDTHFWWMGGGDGPMNNWTAWCTQNILITALCFPWGESMAPDVLPRILTQARASLGCFLDEYGEDGCCDEGALYYRHAGLCLFTCMELLGAAASYDDPKIRNIAAYILHVHAAGPWYVNFADCSPVPGRCGVREFLFGRRTGNPALMAFAAEDFRQSEDRLCTYEHSLYDRLLTLFTYNEIMGYAVTLHGSAASMGHAVTAHAGTAHKPDAGLPIAEPTDDPTCAAHPDIFYPSTGLLITRDARLLLAVKAGDNADSHNHNDVGSFIVYKDGRPLFIDVGVETYTKKTFSPQRYGIWTMQSQYHNLPTIRGCMQRDGGSFRATGVTWTLGGKTGAATLEANGQRAAREHNRDDDERQNAPERCLVWGMEMEIATAYDFTGTAGHDGTLPGMPPPVTYRRKAMLFKDAAAGCPAALCKGTPPGHGLVPAGDPAPEPAAGPTSHITVPEDGLEEEGCAPESAAGPTGHILIEDRFSATAFPLTLNLMTYEKPVFAGNRLHIGDLGVCEVSKLYESDFAPCINTDTLLPATHTAASQPTVPKTPVGPAAQPSPAAAPPTVTIEAIPITDARLGQAWKHDIYRTIITPDAHCRGIRLEIW